MEGFMRFLRNMQLSNAALTNIANYLRYQTMKTCLIANNGHLGACTGATELLTGLYFGGIANINPKNDKDESRDYIMMRGHTGPIRYPIFNLLGWLNDEELNDYRKFGSRLHGHEDHHFTPGVDIGPNGSLGMLLSYGTGVALRRKHTGNPGRVFVFIGDGEEQEGNVSEAARHSATLGLSNLIAIIDKNGKQLSNPTSNTDKSNTAEVWEGYGWHVIELNDGNDLKKVITYYKAAIALATELQKPILIIAHTIKGIGIEGAENHFSGYHTISTVNKEIVERSAQTIKEMIDEQLLEKSKLEIRSFGDHTSPSTIKFGNNKWNLSTIEVSADTPKSPNHCQFDYFKKLSLWIQKSEFSNDTYFLTADVTRQDHVESIGIRKFSHFYNVGIREQHMIAFAHGISLADPNVRIIINSVDVFSLRASDQLLAAAQGGSNMCIIGDVSGLTNGKNGKTHQSSAQPIALRDIPGVQYLEPYDCSDMFNAMNRALSHNTGITYIRVHNDSLNSESNVHIERNLEQYTIYESDSSKKPNLIILASGCIVDQAIKASKILDSKGLNTRVINVVSHKPHIKTLELIENGEIPILTAYNGLPLTLEYFLGRLLILQPGSKIPVTCHKGFEFGTTGDFESLLKHFMLDSESLANEGIKITN